jgi:hypothetical protein
MSGETPASISISNCAASGEVGGRTPGRDDKSISTLEFDGVELAAIQGRNQKLEEQTKEKNAEIQNLKQQNDLLAERLNELEAAM